MNRHELAKIKRVKTLMRMTELLTACTCEYPLVKYRNVHMHGHDKDGAECPAIAVWKRHQEEDEVSRL